MVGNHDLPPYKLAMLVEMANKIMKQMTCGIAGLTYEEMEIILSLLWSGMEKGREYEKRLSMEKQDSQAEKEG